MVLLVVSSSVGMTTSWWMSYLFTLKLSILKWDWLKAHLDIFVLCVCQPSGCDEKAALAVSKFVI